MSNNSILTGYVSEIDQLLESFDKKNPIKSNSQIKESEKYKRIYALRDKPVSTEKTSDLWEDF